MAEKQEERSWKLKGKDRGKSFMTRDYQKKGKERKKKGKILIWRIVGKKRIRIKLNKRQQKRLLNKERKEEKNLWI